MSAVNELRNFRKVSTPPAEKIGTAKPDKSDAASHDDQVITQVKREQTLASLIKANDKSQETLSSLGQETDIETQERSVKQHTACVQSVKALYDNNVLFIEEVIRKHTGNKSFRFTNPNEISCFDWSAINDEQIRKELERYAKAVLKEYKRSVSLYNKIGTEATRIALANPENKELQKAVNNLIETTRQFYLHFNDFKNLKQLEQMLESLNRQDTGQVLTQAHTCANFMSKLDEELKRLEKEYERLASQQEAVDKEIALMSKSNAQINENNRQVMYS